MIRIFSLLLLSSGALFGHSGPHHDLGLEALSSGVLHFLLDPSHGGGILLLGLIGLSIVLLAKRFKPRNWTLR